MLTHLSYLAKTFAHGAKYAKFNLFSKIFEASNRTAIVQFYSKNSDQPSSSSDMNILDVNIDKMMYEDDEFASNYNYEPKPQDTTSTDLDGGVIAPMDVNPWTDEEMEKQGTVDMEYVEKYKEEIHYPEPPSNRSGYYEFEGIKIWLPRKMLTPATYRYRLNKEEEQTLPDDIRICRFEKFRPTS